MKLDEWNIRRSKNRLKELFYKNNIPKNYRETQHFMITSLACVEIVKF